MDRLNRKKGQIKVTSRLMDEGDHSRLEEIEFAWDGIFSNSSEKILYLPWDRRNFNQFVADNGVGIVAERRDEVLGFVLYIVLKRKIGIVKLAVHPAFSRNKIGSQIIACTREMISFSRGKIFSDIPETNLPAQLFLRANGFIATNVVRGYFEQTGEDAFHFECTF